LVDLSLIPWLCSLLSESDQKSKTLKGSGAETFFDQGSRKYRPT